MDKKIPRQRETRRKQWGTDCIKQKRVKFTAKNNNHNKDNITNQSYVLNIYTPNNKQYFMKQRQEMQGHREKYTNNWWTSVNHSH